MVSRGEIWLANLNPRKKNNEIGKTRPVLIYQNNEINHSNTLRTIVIPLTTSLIDNAEPIRLRVKKRGEMVSDSDIVITQIRAIDNSRFVKKVGKLTKEELIKVRELFDEITL